MNSATRVNAVEINDKKRKKKDISEITYYNYDKKKILCNQLPKILEAKKLISVLATSMSMTSAKEKALKCVFCIYYSIQFKKDLDEIWALINSGSEIDLIATTYAKKLGLQI